MTKPLDRATIAEIAARYAAVIDPNLCAVVVPQGVSAVPVPVWREASGNLSAGLYDADGAKQFRARMWAHSIKPKRLVTDLHPKGVSPARATKLRKLHSLGLTNAEIAEAGGGTALSVKKAINILGLTANKK